MSTLKSRLEKCEKLHGQVNEPWSLVIDWSVDGDTANNTDDGVLVITYEDEPREDTASR